MKKIDKNLIIFISAFLFIIAGWWSVSYISGLGGSALTLIENLDKGYSAATAEFTAGVEASASERLTYHNLLLDLNSIKCNLLNTRMVKKDDEIIIRSDFDSLAPVLGEMSDETINNAVSCIDELYRVSSENGAEFLYAASPHKSSIVPIPENFDNYAMNNHQRFIQSMRSADIPVLDLAEMIASDSELAENAFFRTDHHWKPHIGFWASSSICEELSSRYGFEYDKEMTNTDNFSTETYRNVFLGSYGKKVGRFFTDGGAEDIDLITPKFETSFTEEQPYKDLVRTGTFEDILVRRGHLTQEKNLYKINTYVAYTGGDYRLQIIKNNLNQSGKKILVVRDSFACVVTPFLALNAAELHIADMRDFIPTETFNLYDYIAEIKPDYVVVLFNGVADPDNSGEKYDFNHQMTD